jgi:hypothetical protein
VDVLYLTPQISIKKNQRTDISVQWLLPAIKERRITTIEERANPLIAHISPHQRLKKHFERELTHRDVFCIFELLGNSKMVNERGQLCRSQSDEVGRGTSAYQANNVTGCQRASTSGNVSMMYI